MPYGPCRVGVDSESVTLSSPWYAAYTRHQHEKAVARNLSNKGFETFLPLYTTARLWKDRTKHLLLPLFPGYVFLRGRLERWLEIVTTPGVHWLVGSAGQPAGIPQAEIDAIRRVVEKGIRIEPHCFLQCGDWVRVKSGPLEGLEGILLRKKNSSRLVLSVELLEKSIAMEVDAFAVERVARRRGGAATRVLSVAVPERIGVLDDEGSWRAEARVLGWGETSKGGARR